jgi:hypothetical protein
MVVNTKDFIGGLSSYAARTIVRKLLRRNSKKKIPKLQLIVSWSLVAQQSR